MCFDCIGDTTVKCATRYALNMVKLYTSQLTQRLIKTPPFLSNFHLPDVAIELQKLLPKPPERYQSLACNLFQQSFLVEFLMRGSMCIEKRYLKKHCTLIGNIRQMHEIDSNEEAVMDIYIYDLQ